MSAIVDLDQELLEVSQKLETAIAALYSPLGELAKAQLTQAQPLVRAAWVLTVGMDVDELSLFRQQRIYLASAVEMLRLAISLHKLLLETEISYVDSTPDKPILGSAILTGDYCFGQAAWLAAQTDHTVVVQMFAQMLQLISESQLRRLFQELGRFDSEEMTGKQDFLDDHLLMLTAGRAACLLSRQESPAIGKALEGLSYSHEALFYLAFQRSNDQELTFLQQQSWHWLTNFLQKP